MCYNWVILPLDTSSSHIRRGSWRDQVKNSNADRAQGSDGMREVVQV